MKSKPTRNEGPFSSPHRIDGIQILRGLAASLVVLFHLTVLVRGKFHYSFCEGFFLFGYSGVDLFFVLSGFIIFKVHRADIGRGEKCPAYLYKRIARVYPLYWLVTLILLPAYFLSPSFGYGYEREFGTIIRSLFLIPQDHYPIVGVAWSLTHEILFYSVFAFMIATPPKLGVSLCVGWLGTSLILYFHFLLTQHPIVPGPWFGVAFSRYNLEFLFGILGAILAERLIDRRSFSRWLWLIGATTFLFAGYWDEALDSAVGKLHTVFTYGLSALLLTTGASLAVPSRSNVIMQALILLGDASYSLYLVHYPFMSFEVKLAQAFPSLLHLNMAIITCCIGAMAFVCGIALHILIERPLVTKLREFTPNRGGLRKKLILGSSVEASAS